MHTSTRHLHGTAVPTSAKPFHHYRASRHRSIVAVSSSYCPYRTLGISEAADEKEIKTAYRKLALRYHPDISTAADAQAKFISIQEAYDILTGKARGKEIGAQNNSSFGSWDFHDWYWQFRMSRSWDRQKNGGPKAPTSTAGHAQPEAKEGIRTQLAGLRHRAAIRKVQAQNANSASESETEDEPESAPNAQDPESHVTAADIGDGANYTGEASSQDWQHQKPKFVATESRRAQVFGQLSGLKRKSKLKQQGSF